MSGNIRRSIIRFLPLIFAVSAVIFAAATMQASAGGTLFSISQSASNRVVLGQDGSILVSAEPGGRISVLDLATGLERASLQGDSGSIVTELAISPDGNKLASVAAGVLTIWDIRSGRQREISATDPQGGGVRGLVFGSDGRILAGIEENARIVVWDVASGSEKSVFSPVDGPVSDIALRPDGSMLASSGGAAQITFWDLKAGTKAVSYTHLTLPTNA